MRLHLEVEDTNSALGEMSQEPRSFHAAIVQTSATLEQGSLAVKMKEEQDISVVSTVDVNRT
jgi:hypothetical protein